MSLSAVKTWEDGEILESADLNAEFTNIYSNPNTYCEGMSITAATIGTMAGTFTGAWSSMPAGTKLLFPQATAPTGWTIDNTGLTDAANRGMMIVVAHSNQYAADGGTQNPVSMSTPAQTLSTDGNDNGGAAATGSVFTTNSAGNSRLVKNEGGGGAQTNYFWKATVTAVTLTPYYRYCIVAIKN